MLHEERRESSSGSSNRVGKRRKQHAPKRTETDGLARSTAFSQSRAALRSQGSRRDGRRKAACLLACLLAAVVAHMIRVCGDGGGAAQSSKHTSIIVMNVCRSHGPISVAMPRLLSGRSEQADREAQILILDRAQ